MQTLLCDVRKHILQHYARSYAPWWGIACKQWQSEKTSMHEPRHAHGSRCEVLALEGRIDKLQEILEQTGNRIYDRTYRLHDERKERVMVEAGRGGHAELLRWLNTHWRVTPGMWVRVVVVAARSGHDHIVRLCAELRPSVNMSYAMAGAARGGHEPLVRLCRDWGANHYDWAMHEAARCGHASIVRLCCTWSEEVVTDTIAEALRTGADDSEKSARACLTMNIRCLSRTMCRAARGGHLSIVEQCRGWATASLSRARAFAARTGDRLVVKMCEEWLLRGANDTMRFAAKGGHEQIVRMCYDEYKATATTDTMAMAAKKGHVYIVLLCHDVWKTTSVSRAMTMAARGGHAHIVRLCHDEYGASDVDEAMRAAADEGHHDIVQLCYGWGARNLREVLAVAASEDHSVRLELPTYPPAMGSCDNQGCAISTGRKEVVKLCKQWLAQT